MSLILFVGPSNIGKTFAMREWMLPALLHDPGQVTDMAPPEGFSTVLIHDPPTPQKPDGQYVDIVRYADVAEWRRAEKRPRVARFSSPTLEAMCGAAVEYGRMVLAFDEANRLIGNERKPPAQASELIESGRHYGCLIIGACRRLKAVHTSARSNIEVAYFGNLADDDDRDDAAAAAGVDPELLRGIKQQGVFLEWVRSTGDRALIRVENRRKMVLRRL